MLKMHYVTFFNYVNVERLKPPVTKTHGTAPPAEQRYSLLRLCLDLGAASSDRSAFVD